MAIQHRRGADVDFKPDRMKAGELALTTDGTRKMYAAFAPGDVKEVAFKEDIPEGGGGGSVEQVQADYAQADSTQPDYIKNKLVGKEVTYSDTLTWDGNTDGLIADSEGLNYLVSETLPTFEEFSNGGKIIMADGSEISFSSEYVADLGNGAITISGVVWAIYENNVDADGIVFSKAGLYFNNSGGQYIKALTVNNFAKFLSETTKKLTAEYLEPFEVVTKGGDTLTWDGNTKGLESVDMSLAVKGMIAYKISDNVITQNDFNYGFSMFSPTDGEIALSPDEIADLEIFYANGFIFVDFFAVVPTDNFVATDFGGIMFPSKGVYAFVADGQPSLSSLTINNYTGFTTTEKKLKGEYLIDTNSIILKSSGGKRFKVTVSDTGTLTATEI